MTARNWLEQRCIFILMIRRHPKATLTSALVPYTTRSRTHGTAGAPPRWGCTAAFGESWLVRLYALDVAPTDAELVADRCWQAGAAGIWESTEEDGAVTLRVGVEEAAVGRFLEALPDVGPRAVTAPELVELHARTGTVAAVAGPVPPQAPPPLLG